MTANKVSQKGNTDNQYQCYNRTYFIAIKSPRNE